MTTLMFVLALLALAFGSVCLVQLIHRCHMPRRKPRIWKVAAAFLFLAAMTANAAESSFLDGITLSPVGAYKQVGFTHGPGTYGAGVDLGLPVNKFVSIHVRNLAFENNDKWGGSVVDETTVYGRADFVSFAAEKLRLFGTGGGQRLWDTQEWGFGIGLGVEYRFTKHIAASVSEEVWALTQGAKNWRTVTALTFTF